MAWHEMDIKSVLNELKTGKKGLSSEEASSRLQKYGTNEIKDEKKISPLDIFLRQFVNFLVVILIVASIFSAFIGEIIDAIAIIIIVILNGAFGFFQEFKAEKSMDAMRKMTAQESMVIRNGKKMKINSKELVPGDVVILEQGDRVPADMRLMEVAEFKIDESALTGESKSVKKSVSTYKTKTLAEMKCIAFMGTIVTYGRATGVVVGTGMTTEIGKIAHEVHTTPSEDTPLQKSLGRFGKTLGTIILVICVFVVFAGLLRGSEPVGIIIIAIALAVAAIPEGLPAVVTITLAIGMQRMAKKNAIIRKLQAVETLGSVSVICADKTGTLTKNEMTIRKIWTDYKMLDVMGNGYEPVGDFLNSEKKVERDPTLSLLLMAGALCNNAQLVKENDEQRESKENERSVSRSWGVVGDPTEGAIIVAAQKFGLEKERLDKENPRKFEMPFTSERKMMSTINAHDKGFIMCTKGAAEVVLPLCSRIMISGRPIKLSEHERRSILGINNDMASHALRVLAVAYKETKGKPEKNNERSEFSRGENARSVSRGENARSVSRGENARSVSREENDLVFLGLVGMIDPPRQEVKNDIKICKEAGIRVVMITGDHSDTASAIADQLGIKGSVVTGEQLENMGHEKLADIVEDVAIYARVNPEHKALIVEALRKKNHIIAMTGDGINDAPALKKADIGVAMGIKGKDVAKEASDIVLTDDNFSSIVSAVKEGRTIYDNIKGFIFYLLSSNIAEVMIVFSAILIGFTDGLGRQLLPITAIQLLWINLITDGLPALALGIDPPLPGTMKRNPRDPKERLLSRNMLVRMFITGIVMTVIVLSLFIYYIEQPEKAITVSFTSIVLLEMVNVMRIRAERGHKLFSNSKLMLAIACSVILQVIVIHAAQLQGVFNTVSLNLVDWGMIAIGLMAMVIVSVVRIKIEKPFR